MGYNHPSVSRIPIFLHSLITECVDRVVRAEFAKQFQGNVSTDDELYAKFLITRRDYISLVADHMCDAHNIPTYSEVSPLQLNRVRLEVDRLDELGVTLQLQYRISYSVQQTVENLDLHCKMSDQMLTYVESNISAEELANRVNNYIIGDEEL